jgi:hypothetical protein
MSKTSELIQEVIQFLIDNEQYGDNWKEHIDVLNQLLLIHELEAIIKPKKV